MKKMMRIGLILLVVGTLGTILSLVVFDINPKGLFNVGPDFRPQISTTNNSHSVKENLNSFDSLDIDVDLADISIVKGDQYAIEVTECEGCPYTLTYSVQGSTLTLKLKVHKYFVKTFDTPKIIITTMEDLGQVNIDSDVGTINISNINIDQLVVDNDVSDILIRNCNVNFAEVESSVGNIDIDGTFETLKIESDVGDSYFKGQARHLEIESDLGKVDATILDSQDAYHIKAKTDLGSLSINGQKQNGFDNTFESNPSLEDIKSIEISNNLGDIILKFMP